MLPTLIGVGFAATLTLIGFLGKGLIERFDRVEKFQEAVLFCMTDLLLDLSNHQMITLETATTIKQRLEKAVA